MADLARTMSAKRSSSINDIGFAACIIIMLMVLFLPLPAVIIDLGLAASIALAILILMVALWVDRPLDFSAFPTILLISTMLRLALNVATTRLILTNGAEGHTAAGHVVAGFASFVMGGDLIIGLVVFVILVTINFLVITKGATRMAEVGARFTLDAVPGKQMAIDADLSAGIIDDNEARLRRRELEEESAFFGAMDGASKFVRGDAVAGLIITAINMFGGVAIGVLRHDMPFATAIDVFSKLSVGDGLVSQIPALVVSLASGLLISKGGTRGSADKAVMDQLGHYPKALFLAGVVVSILSLAPGLPFAIFAIVGGCFFGMAYVIPRREQAMQDAELAEAKERQSKSEHEARQSVKGVLQVPELELCLGKLISGVVMTKREEIAQRMANMRRHFARQYGFVVPEIKLTEDVSIGVRNYCIKLHGTIIASGEVRVGDYLIVVGSGPRPNIPADETTEPAFGAPALWISEVHAGAARRAGFAPIDNVSVILTHVREAIVANLSPLLSYKSLRHLVDRLEPEYRKLLEEIVPAHMSNSGLLTVLKLLLAERVSIRNLALILESVAEIAPFVRKPEQIVEHVRMRLSQQICGDISEDGKLRILRLGSRWELAFHQALKRDARGEVIELDLDQKTIEQFCKEATAALQDHLDKGTTFALTTTPEARPYVHMIVDRLFPALPILSHVEIARAPGLQALGSIS